jgi:rhodanese-related sulfurtransferase
MIILLSYSCSTGTTSIESISAMELKQKLRQDKFITIIDVRTVGEFDGPLGHISNAQLKPLSELIQTVEELKLSNNAPIYIVCRSGNRSGQATKILRENGIIAFNVEGGMIAWNKLK